MSRTISDFLTFPTFDDEDLARRAWALFATSLLMTGGAIAYGLVVVFVSPSSWPRLVGAGLMILISLGCALAARGGRVWIPGLFLSLWSWVALLVISALSGGVSAPASSGQVLVLAIATLILGWKTGLFFAGLSVLGLTTLYALEIYGHLPTRSLQVDSTFSWLTQSVFLIVMGGLIAFAVRYLEKMLGRAHEEIGEHKRTEVALRRSERNLVEAQRITHLGSWEWDIKNDRVLGSEEVYRIIRIPPEELEGNYAGVMRLAHPEDIAQFEKGLREAISSGAPLVEDYRLVLDDGDIRHVQSRAEIEFDERGNPAKVIGTVQDLTDWRFLEEAHRKSEHLYTLFAQNSGDVIWTMDLNFRWTYVSPSVEKLRGFTPEEVMAETIQGSITPSSYETARNGIAEITKAITQKDGEAGGQVIVELEATCKDGSTVWTEQKLALTHDRSGKASGIIGVSRDISARKQAEEIATRLGRILDDSLNEVYILEASTLRIVQVNRGARENLGYDLAGLRRFTLDDLQPGTTRKELESVLAPLVAEDRDRVSFTTKHQRQDGSDYCVELQFQRASFGTLPAYVAFGVDTTERLLLEDELRQSQKMEAVGRLAGGVAHDFNNLLTAILGHADFLVDELETKGLPTSDAQEIRNAAERAASLTNQLLAFSRKQILETQVMNANESVASVSKLLDRLIGENITLVTQLEPNLPRIEADPAQIEQVLINLAVNARDAMPHGGRLTLRTRTASSDMVSISTKDSGKKPTNILIEISDDGEGMDAATQAQIFEPFFTTKPKGEGSGLGLSMSYGIIKQSGGDIQVESHQGRGTTFRIYLPTTETKENSATENDNGASPRQGTERVLLVEDEASVRRLTSRILKQNGYSVSEAADGTEALKFLSQLEDRPDLLLTDVILPTMNGIELADQVLASAPDLKILFMSGYTDEIKGADGLLRAGQNFLQKPFTAAALLSIVRQVLDEQEIIEA